MCWLPDNLKMTGGLLVWLSDKMTFWNNQRISESLMDCLTDEMKWSDNILKSDVLMIWKTWCLLTGQLMIWLSENVWRLALLTDWLSDALRMTDNLMFWPSDSQKCQKSSDISFFQTLRSSESQNTRISVLFRTSDLLYWYQFFPDG